MEEEQRNRDEVREQYLNAEKRATILQSEREELAVALEVSRRKINHMLIFYLASRTCPQAGRVWEMFLNNLKVSLQLQV